mmetsp:Transcript_97258/g.192730  ORF Transcript_97258/g.192730 Transcript_97258/m.192730 type:complete len:127 (+) Transcript_97258:78-458(+)
MATAMVAEAAASVRYIFVQESAADAQFKDFASRLKVALSSLRFSCDIHHAYCDHECQRKQSLDTYVIWMPGCVLKSTHAPPACTVLSILSKLPARSSVRIIERQLKANSTSKQPSIRNIGSLLLNR